MTTSKTTVSFGVQAGGKEANAAVLPHYIALRRLLAERCVGPYSDLIREFALVLRIDGSIWHWEKSGAEGAVIDKKTKCASVDIYMPKAAWERKDTTSIRAFLAKETTQGLTLIADKAFEAKIPLDREPLMRDLKTAIDAFQAE